MDSINLHFDDYDKTSYLIKFGKKEHLQQIINGKIRFTNLKIYQQTENRNIGDADENVTDILHQDGNLKILFKHPYIENGNEIDVSNSVISMKNFSNPEKYVSCFSYFTAKDIFENNIFSDKILEENEWCDVLLILESKLFVSTVEQILSKNNVIFSPVRYIDYSKNQHRLNEFSKSVEYEHQKEIRFSIEYNNDNSNIKRIDNNTLEINLGRQFLGVIIPAKEFRESFFIEKK